MWRYSNKLNTINFYDFFFLRGIVTLTDLPENVQQLKKNIDENKHLLKMNPQAVALKWGNPFESEPFDFLLMADCIYYPEVGVLKIDYIILFAAF